MRIPRNFSALLFYSKATFLALSIAGSAHSQTFPPTSQDLIALHYDVSPDLDDLHAIASGANLSEWFAINPAVVIGTYGYVGLGGPQNNDLKYLYETATYPQGQGPDTGETRRQKAQRVTDAAYGANNYLDTGAGWTEAVTAQAAIFWPVLQNGATVLVAEGGPMDFTADVLIRLQSFHGATDAQLKNVYVIQHALGFNVRNTLPANLEIMRTLATYIPIDNGNAGNNSTADLEDRSMSTTTSNFAQWARNDNGQSNAWTEALDRFSSIVDFSDTVEYLHILDIPLADVSDPDSFATYCESNTCLVAPPPQCNGLPVTINLAKGQLPTAGDDVILGTLGNDTINALDGNDIICALEGDDVVSSGNGADWVDAGPGNDVVDGGNGNDTIYGDSGIDTLNGGADNDEIHGEEDGDIIIGNTGDDTIYGGAGIDEIFGGTGDDTIDTGAGGNRGTGLRVDGGAGNDTITGGTGDDEIRASTGNDSIYGASGDDALYGGGGDDTIIGQSGDDLIRGNGAKDVLYGGNGNDDIDGGSGADIIYGGNNIDSIHGSTGDDMLFGGAGNDAIHGGGGDDTLYGNRGNDSLFGGGSDDVLIGGSDVDSCDGDSGTDSALYCESETNIQ